MRTIFFVGAVITALVSSIEIEAENDYDQSYDALSLAEVDSHNNSYLMKPVYGSGNPWGRTDGRSYADVVKGKKAAPKDLDEGDDDEDDDEDDDGDDDGEDDLDENFPKLGAKPVKKAAAKAPAPKKPSAKDEAKKDEAAAKAGAEKKKQEEAAASKKR